MIVGSILKKRKKISKIKMKMKMKEFEFNPDDLLIIILEKI